METIGLKDKHGKEIRRFDIVDFIIDRWSNGTFIVVQGETGYLLQGLDDLNDRVDLSKTLTGELIIIGGVHEAFGRVDESTR